MRKVILALALTTAMIAPAPADVNMQLPDKIKDTLNAMQVMLDQCIGSVISKSEATACQQMRLLLIQLTNQPTTPIPAPANNKEVPSKGGAGAAGSSGKP